MTNSFWTNATLIKNEIYIRGFDKGLRFTDRIKYRPYHFVKKVGGSYSTIHGEPVEKMEFDSVYDAKDFVKKYDNVSNFEIYGSPNYLYNFINDKYPGQVEYDPKLVNVAYIDIETAYDPTVGIPDIEKADQEITAITLMMRNKIYVFGYKPYEINNKSVEYFECKDEYSLLQKFIKCWQFLDIDIVTGWYIEFFDIPYITNRIKRLFNDKEASKLSPLNWISEKKVSFRGKEIQSYLFYGMAILDYYQLYRKFNPNLEESYTLDYISNKILKEKKVPYQQQGYKDLNDLYKRNFQLFIDYNIQDVALVNKIEDRLKYIELVMALTYNAKVNYNDTLTTVRQWECIIHNYLLDQRTVFPQYKEKIITKELMGGFVKEPKLGMSKWVVSFDLTSLYPHIQMLLNLSPETFVRRINNFPSIDDIAMQKVDLEQYHENKYSLAANGCLFRNDKQGFIPAMAQKVFNDRKKYKDISQAAKDDYEKTGNLESQKTFERYDGYQKATKILANSLYGAVSNRYFLFYNFDQAEAVTATGQLIIKFVANRLNSFVNGYMKTKDIDYIIASDTDSVYVNFEPLVNKVSSFKNMNTSEIIDMLDKFSKQEVQPYLEKIFEEFKVYLNAYQQKLFMKRESIAEKAIFRAKKNYILNVWDDEGVRYKEPKLKMQGIEAVRSSTPFSCRENIKKALKIIMNEDEETLQKFIREFRKEFLSMPFEYVASPRGIKGLNKYRDKNEIYKLGTPIHTKGVLWHNKLLIDKNIRNIPPIQDGEKIRFAYLKTPNPIHCNVIAAADTLPKEFGLDKYIDKELQFTKAFLDPISSIIESIDWDTEPRSTLEGFFE